MFWKMELLDLISCHKMQNRLQCTGVVESVFAGCVKILASHFPPKWLKTVKNGFVLACFRHIVILLFFIQWCSLIFRLLRDQGASFRAKPIILGSWELLEWADSGLKHIILVAANCCLMHEKPSLRINQASPTQ